MEQTKQYEYVDLGLPSGLKWAKCNVGAENETDYGDYFMWGSTTPNNDTPCDWEHAPFNNGSSDYDETYFKSVKDTVCPNGVLAKEIQELIDYTTNEWVEDFNGTGVSGRKFTGSNGNSIFIPAADFRSGSSFYGREDYNGDIWSSSLFTSRPKNAWYLNFFSDDFYVDYADRNYSFVVRGVMD